MQMLVPLLEDSQSEGSSSDETASRKTTQTPVLPPLPDSKSEGISESGRGVTSAVEGAPTMSVIRVVMVVNIVR
jgi:hypothetical protein